MSLSAQQKKYGKLHWTESLAMVTKLIPLPAVLLWSVLTTAHAPFNKARSLKRIAGDAVVRYVSSSLNIAQMQRMLGTTRGMYKQWTKANKLPAVIDELGEDARLLWIGPKRLERVVMFVHGGGFLLPATDFSLSFWRYVQLELEKQHINVGIALFSYSLVPAVTFPTQLRQACLALEFLLAAGVAPQNLQLVGDSAGGNLVLQLLSQMLHPRASVPEIHLVAPLRGVLLLSPWVNLSADSASQAENDGRDYINPRVLAGWGRLVLAHVPDVDRAFAEAERAPAGWFAGAERVVERVLITAGGAECLLDDIVSFAEAFKTHHQNTELVVQPGGLHEDMFLDFLVREKKVGILTPLTVQWLAAGFTA
ncbi:Alpha/Beta hydrolase protein [Mycena vulgaris]|nr:Alpha/Beta hydrolase protein [Mycena vulgaris]